MLSWRDIHTWTVTLSLEHADSFNPYDAHLPRLERGQPITRTMTSSEGRAIAFSGRLHRAGEPPIEIAGNIGGPGHYVMGREGLRRLEDSDGGYLKLVRL